jgi:replication-associated recombination protein RarA
MPSDRLLTKNGRAFDEVASLLQKSLRRDDIVFAARAADELFPRYANYIWNRLLTVSAEDCAGIITGEVVALFDGWQKVNASTRDRSRGRVFISKAIILIARARKSRDADELNLLVVDRIPDEDFDAALAACESVEADPSWTIPDYVYDCHTRRGKARGKTKAEFLRAERDALVNQTTVFVNLDEMIDSIEYVQPELPW